MPVVQQSRIEGDFESLVAHHADVVEDGFARSLRRRKVAAHNGVAGLLVVVGDLQRDAIAERGEVESPFDFARPLGLETGVTKGAEAHGRNVLTEERRRYRIEIGNRRVGVRLLSRLTPRNARAEVVHPLGGVVVDHHPRERALGIHRRTEVLTEGAVLVAAHGTGHVQPIFPPNLLLDVDTVGDELARLLTR